MTEGFVVIYLVSYFITFLCCESKLGPNRYNIWESVAVATFWPIFLIKNVFIGFWSALLK